LRDLSHARDMARRTPHLRDSVVTVASTALHNNGLNLYCLDCNHNAAWSPSALAAVEPPSRKVWDFKRRRRCSRCGARVDRPCFLDVVRGQRRRVELGTLARPDRTAVVARLGALRGDTAATLRGSLAMTLDADTARRDAAIKGHDFHGGDRCALCGITIADLVALQDIPPCDVLGHGRTIERAMSQGPQ